MRTPFEDVGTHYLELGRLTGTSLRVHSGKIPLLSKEGWWYVGAYS